MHWLHLCDIITLSAFFFRILTFASFKTKSYFSRFCSIATVCCVCPNCCLKLSHVYYWLLVSRAHFHFFSQMKCKCLFDNGHLKEFSLGLHFLFAFIIPTTLTVPYGFYIWCNGASKWAEPPKKQVESLALPRFLGIHFHTWHNPGCYVSYPWVLPWNYGKTHYMAKPIYHDFCHGIWVMP